jgi:hypothetical protein
MSGPHNDFFYYLTGRLENAEFILRLVLPEDFCRRAEWSTLWIESSLFFNSALRGVEGDRVFSVLMRDSGQRAFIILEHQSSEDWGMAERLERYEVRVVEQWREQYPEERHSPLVVSAVLYHGERSWKASRRYEGLTGLPLEEVERAGWGDWVRHPEYRLEVLKQRSEEELLVRPGPHMAKLGLVLMQHSGRPDLLNRRLPEWVPLLQQVYATPYGPADLEASVCYARLIGNKATDEVLRHVLYSLAPPSRTEGLMEIASSFVREALKETRAEVEARTQAKTRAEDVLRILDARDVPLNRSTRERILACRDLAQLNRWFDRALRAHSLAEVLDEPATGPAHPHG